LKKYLLISVSTLFVLIVLYIAVSVTYPSKHNEIKVVCLGDSLTNGYGSTGDKTYPYYLNQLMPDTRVLNKGINGQTTDQIKSRFYDDVLLNHPNFVIIIAGTNDFFINVPVNIIEQHLNEMYSLALENGITPVLCTIPPSKAFTKPDQVLELNNWIRNKAMQKHLPFVDLYYALDDPSKSGTLNPEYDSGDGTHPNNEGYKLMANEIYKRVNLYNNDF
jgi:lysophospholipase L1-like esterase